MAYCVQTDEPLKQGLRRTIAEELRSALAELNDEALDQATAIHDVRKHCKKIRAALRLLRDDLNQQYPTEDRRYRNAAKAVSGNRDADAMLETYHDLLARFGDKITAETAAPIYTVLTARKAVITNRDENAALAKLTEAIQTSYCQIDRLPIDDRSATSVTRAISRTYAKARAVMKKAHRSNHPEDYHGWRKWVKYHGYHLQLLRKVLPDVSKSQRTFCKRLGELLGDHHNLFVLRALLLNEPAFDECPAARKTFIRLIDRRTQKIEQASRRLGKKLFAKKPSKQQWRLK